MSRFDNIINAHEAHEKEMQVQKLYFNSKHSIVLCSEETDI